MTPQEIDNLADIIAQKVADDIDGTRLVIHIMEHEVTGAGRVIDDAKARTTPCKCVSYEGELYCHSEGILGLISSKKNPEQIAQYCAVGKIMKPDGLKTRFAQIKEAISRAHKKWEKGEGGLVEWWDAVAEEMVAAKISL